MATSSFISSVSITNKSADSISKVINKKEANPNLDEVRFIKQIKKSDIKDLFAEYYIDGGK
jgi:hypothetical protein